MNSQLLSLFPYTFSYEWSRRPALYRGVVRNRVTGQILWRTSWCKRKAHCEALLHEKLARREGWN